jgi:hypothetical protein
MSDVYYSTRLLYIENRIGVAKLHGKARKIALPPRLAGMEVVEIDYTPERGCCRVREKNAGWRDMVASEIRAADAYLKELLG